MQIGIKSCAKKKIAKDAKRAVEPTMQSASPATPPQRTRTYSVAAYWMVRRAPRSGASILSLEKNS